MPTITKAELKKKLENPNFLLLDVRTKEEFNSGNIPTSKLVPVQEFSNFELDNSAFQSTYGFSKPQVNDEIIVYCKMGGRANTAAGILEKYGYKNVTVYSGSWMDWISD